MVAVVCVLIMHKMSYETTSYPINEAMQFTHIQHKSMYGQPPLVSWVNIEFSYDVNKSIIVTFLAVSLL